MYATVSKGERHGQVLTVPHLCAVVVIDIWQATRCYRLIASEDLNTVHVVEP